MAAATSKTFAVKGFHCSGCSDNVGSALNRLDGVIRAQADYETRQVEVRFDAERVTEEDILATAPSLSTPLPHSSSPMTGPRLWCESKVLERRSHPAVTAMPWP